MEPNDALFCPQCSAAAAIAVLVNLSSAASVPLSHVTGLRRHLCFRGFTYPFAVERPQPIRTSVLHTSLCRKTEPLALESDSQGVGPQDDCLQENLHGRDR